MTAQAFSNSELSSFLRCRRRWYLTYVLWLAPQRNLRSPTGNAWLGTRVHRALENSVSDSGALSSLDWVDQIYGAEVLAAPEYAADLRAEQALAKTMVEGYEAWAAENGINEGIEIIAAERDVEVPMPGMEDVTLRGKLDQMIRRESDGAVLFRDFKTCDNFTVADGLDISPQPRFYTMLQRLLAGAEGPRADGGEMIYLRRSKRTAAAKPPFYLRAEVRYNRHDLNAAWRRAKGIITDLLAVRLELASGSDHHEVAYPNPMMSCAWDCAFRQLCPLMDDGARWQDMARTEFTQEDPNKRYSQEPVSA